MKFQTWLYCVYYLRFHGKMKSLWFLKTVMGNSFKMSVGDEDCLCVDTSIYWPLSGNYYQPIYKLCYQKGQF